MVKWDHQSLYLRVCEVKSIVKDSWVLWGCHADIYWASGKVLEWPFPEQTPVWLLGTGGPHYPMVCVCSWSLMCYKDWILGAAVSLTWEVQSCCNCRAMECTGSNLIFQGLPSLSLSPCNTDINNTCHATLNLMGPSSKLAFFNSKCTCIMGQICLVLPTASESAFIHWIYCVNT